MCAEVEMIFETGMCIEFGIGNFEVDGRGRIKIINTGGSSAGEGGMGSGDSSDEKEKGELTSPDTGTKSNSSQGEGGSGSSAAGDPQTSKAHEEAEKASQRSV